MTHTIEDKQAIQISEKLKSAAATAPTCCNEPTTLKPAPKSDCNTPAPTEDHNRTPIKSNRDPAESKESWTTEQHRPRPSKETPRPATWTPQRAHLQHTQQHALTTGTQTRAEKTNQVRKQPTCVDAAPLKLQRIDQAAGKEDHRTANQQHQQPKKHSYDDPAKVRKLTICRKEKPCHADSAPKTDNTSPTKVRNLTTYRQKKPCHTNSAPNQDYTDPTPTANRINTDPVTKEDTTNPATKRNNSKSTTTKPNKHTASRSTTETTDPTTQQTQPRGRISEEQQSKHTTGTINTRYNTKRRNMKDKNIINTKGKHGMAVLTAKKSRPTTKMERQRSMSQHSRNPNRGNKLSSQVPSLSNPHDRKH